MDDETLKIFDDNKNELGVASRKEVHESGHWHETFHCWFVSRENGTNYIFFQIRSSTKQDFPNLLDITAAGHILAHETIEDGIREVKEELGIAVFIEELVPLGVIKDAIIQEDFIDKELGNVFLYQGKDIRDVCKLQKEEVSGIVKAEFDSFYELCLGEKSEIQVEGFEINQAGERISINKTVGKLNFVPHDDTYFKRVVKVIGQNINQISTE